MAAYMHYLKTALAAFAALVSFDAASAAAPPPASAFAADPAMGMLRLSPNGERIAWLTQGPDGKPRIAISNLSNSGGTRFNPGERNVNSLFFEDGGRLVITLGDTTRVSGLDWSFAYERYVAIDPATGEGSPVLVRNANSPGAAASGAQWISTLPDEPDTIALASYDEYAGFSLYKAYLTNGMSRLIAAGDQETIDWTITPKGEPKLRLQYDARTRTERLQLRKAESWSELLTRKDVDARATTLMGVSADGGLLIARRNEDFSPIERIDPVTGDITEFARAGDVEINGVWRNALTGVAMGLSYGGADPGVYWLDPNFAALEADFQKKLGGASFRLWSYTRDLNKAIGLRDTGDRAPRWLLYDRASPTVRLLGSMYPALDNVALGRTTPVEAPVRAGETFTVYVTRPPGAAPNAALPTVVLADEPGSRAFPSYDAMRQFLATRGYLVLEPQIRGSVGFGKKRADAGKGQIGAGMQDDLAQTVAWAVRTGLSDPKRVCIVGAGWAGYHAAAGVVFKPEVYACGAAIDAPMDLGAIAVDAARAERQIISTSPGGRRYWLGEGSIASLNAISPARNVDRLAAPLLVIQSNMNGDPDADRARRMAEAARRQAKPLTFVALTGDGYWNETAASRTVAYEAIESFLAKHLKP